MLFNEAKNDKTEVEKRNGNKVISKENEMNQNYCPFKRYFYWRKPIESGNISCSEAFLCPNTAFYGGVRAFFLCLKISESF